MDENRLNDTTMALGGLYVDTLRGQAEIARLNGVLEQRQAMFSERIDQIDDLQQRVDELQVARHDQERATHNLLMIVAGDVRSGLRLLEESRQGYLSNAATDAVRDTMMGSLNRMVDAISNPEVVRQAYGSMGFARASEDGVPMVDPNAGCVPSSRTSV